MDSPYQPTRADLGDVVVETSDIKTFVLEPETPLAFSAGQFVELTVPGLGEAPFTPSSSPADADRLAVTVMKMGRVTTRLHAMEPGARLGLRGPYGNVYPLDRFEGRDVLIMGGGVGMAPLRSLLLALLTERDRYERLILCYGAKTPSDLVYREQLEQWSGRDDMEVHLTVDAADEAWEGKVGVVTTTMEDVTLEAEPAVGVVCGPPIMMKFATAELLKYGFDPERVYLSMERNMSCGIGKCGHCRIGNFYVCRDGPVFTCAQLEDVDHLW
ncbi:MAG: FAD/NAD(P)-binding protein [Planctomycetota bacterium]